MLEGAFGNSCFTKFLPAGWKFAANETSFGNVCALLDRILRIASVEIEPPMAGIVVASSTRIRPTTFAKNLGRYLYVASSTISASTYTARYTRSTVVAFC